MEKKTNIKKYLIITCGIFLIYILIFSLYNWITYLSETRNYVFVTKWGSRGKEDGQFGGLSPTYFQITDEAIEKLKNKLNSKKLKILESLRHTEYHGEKLKDILLNVDFEIYEIDIIFKESALYKPSDIYLNGPNKIAVDKMGNIYVGDYYNHRIQKFDSNGNFITKWSPKDEDGRFRGLDGMTADLEGNIYILMNEQVQKFDSDGNLITKWGSKGKEDGQFIVAIGIATDPEGYIYVLDLSGYIQVFNERGHFIRKWPLYKELCRGKDTNSHKGFANNIAIDKNGNVFVTIFEKEYLRAGFPFGNGKNELLEIPFTNRHFRYNLFGPGVIKYSLSGKYLAKWGKSGDFESTSGISTDLKGNVFVLDGRDNSVKKINSKGWFITEFGGEYGFISSKDGEFSHPTDIAVDSEGNVYVVDSGNQRIQKFAPNPNF